MFKELFYEIVNTPKISWANMPKIGQMFSVVISWYFDKDVKIYFSQIALPVKHRAP